MEYQKTLNLENENITSTNEQIWKSIYEIIHDYYFKVVKLFPRELLNQCRNNSS